MSKKTVFFFWSLIFGVVINSVANNNLKFISTPNLEVHAGTIYGYKISTSDPDSDPLHVSANAIPSWLNLGIMVEVTSFAGTGEGGFADGSATTAKFFSPLGIAVDTSGNI